jgi:hypothetical protein
MNLLFSWLKRWQSQDKRKAERRQWPPLVAHYWTGAAPAAQRVRDISATGMFLLTEARWYPGTVIKITLQDTDGVARDESADEDQDLARERNSIAVQSRVIRQGEDGVGLEFSLPRGPDYDAGGKKQDRVADQCMLDAFLERLREGGSEMVVDVESFEPLS